jgi:hypothetical protein
MTDCIIAHHCNGDHPGKQIMRNFYLPALLQNCRAELPAILGLSASPVSSTNIKEIEYVAKNHNTLFAFHCLRKVDVEREDSQHCESMLTKP